MTYIRRYVPNDWGQLIELVRGFHAESPVHSRFPLEDARIREIADNASVDPNWLMAVAMDDGKMVGLTVLFNFPMFFGPAGEIGDLCFYVVPEKRGTRAAKMLLDYAHQWADRSGASVVRLGITTGIRNDAVMRFLEKNGYQEVGPLMERACVH